MVELLPIKDPLLYDPSVEDPLFFYNNISKKLVKDFIRITEAGIHLNFDNIGKLEKEIDNILQEVQTFVDNHPKVIEFLESKNKEKYDSKMSKAKYKTLEDFLKPYKNTVEQRTYIINCYLLKTENNLDTQAKWSMKDLKTYNEWAKDPFLQRFLDKDKSLENDEFVLEALQSMAEHKAEIYNKSVKNRVVSSFKQEISFNISSAKMKRDFFNYHNVKPLVTSKKTGEASWGREQLEELLNIYSKDHDLYDVVKAFVDHSYSNIISTTFISGFYKYSIDGVLRGNLNIGGAKSFRPTSQNINLLNLPSTGSRYAKPVKKCFTAPEGYVVFSIDFSALEDRVLANLSKDKNKLAIFQEKLDGHCVSATYYYKKRVSELIGDFTDHKEASKKLKELVDNSNKIAKEIRQDAKPVSFGCAYGSFPKKIAQTIGCSLEEATDIFDAYHNELYPGITEFRENRVMKYIEENGYIHLGLGFRMYSSDIQAEGRTLWNAVSQFWSILTLISLHELFKEIDKNNKDVIINATIYDAIYGYVKKDAETIKWLNDTICPIMETDFIENQIIKNEAELEIGRDWYELKTLKHNTTIEEITEIMSTL